MQILSSTWFNILMLIFFTPIGIITMWIFSKWSIIVKILVTIICSAAFLTIVGSITNLFS